MITLLSFLAKNVQYLKEKLLLDIYYALVSVKYALV